MKQKEGEWHSPLHNPKFYVPHRGENRALAPELPIESLFQRKKDRQFFTLMGSISDYQLATQSVK
jgi:hypothetical protein